MIDSPISILIVDDGPANLTSLEVVLAVPGYRMVRANSASEALLALAAGDWALIIWDICLPCRSGMELAQVWKERRGVSFVPLIFLTAAYNDDPRMLEGYDKGAVDYFSKSVHPAVRRSEVAVFAELHRRSHARDHAEQPWRELTAVLESRVDERKVALRAEEARIKLGAQVPGIALLDVDDEADVTHHSAEAARLFCFGDVPLVLPRAVVHATFHPDDLAELTPHIADSLDPNGSDWFEMDHRVIWPGGEVHWLRVRKQVFFEGECNVRHPVRAMLAVSDVSGAKDVNETMRLNVALFFSVIAQAPVGIYVVDAQFRMKQLNPTAMPDFDHIQPLLGLIREGLRAMLLAEADIKVVGEAENGREAVAFVSVLCPDVVLMDITMPGLNGLEARTQTLEQKTKTKVLMFSFHTDPAYAKLAEAIDASGYLIKQSDTHALPAAIRDAHQGKPFIQPSNPIPSESR